MAHLADEVSYKSVLNIVSTLSSILDMAKNWGYVCEGVDQNKLVLRYIASPVGLGRRPTQID